MAKAKSNLVERTVKSAFTLDGAPVRPGQVVTLNPVQLRNLVTAGCVAESDEENDLVLQAALPPTQPAPTVQVGDKGAVQLTDDEAGKLAGIDPALPDLIRAGDMAALSAEQWDKLVAFDGRFGELRPTGQ